jgi:hypothetical protein
MDDDRRLSSRASMSDYTPGRPWISRLIHRRSVFSPASPSLEPEKMWPQAGASGTPHEMYPSLRPFSDAIARRAPGGRPRPASRTRRRSGGICRDTLFPSRDSPRLRHACRGPTWRYADFTPSRRNSWSPVGMLDADMPLAGKWFHWNGVWTRYIFALPRSVLMLIASDDCPFNPTHGLGPSYSA